MFVGSIPISPITMSIEVALISRLTAPTERRLPNPENVLPPTVIAADALQNV
jgi:hypothetical protein